MKPIKKIQKQIQPINKTDMAEKVIYAMYDDDDVLKEGAKRLLQKVLKSPRFFHPFRFTELTPSLA